MMQLTTHFALEEFCKDDPIPAECVPILTELALTILEPIREEFHAAFIITSGYRSKMANANPTTHGQPNSEHIATTTMCAADGYVEGIGVRFVFDWMRGNDPVAKRLPYHQLILEHSRSGSSILHISLNKMMPGIRSVKEGSEHNQSAYINVDHADFDPTASTETSGETNA